MRVRRWVAQATVPRADRRSESAHVGSPQGGAAGERRRRPTGAGVAMWQQGAMGTEGEPRARLAVRGRAPSPAVAACRSLPGTVGAPRRAAVSGRWADPPAKPGPGNRSEVRAREAWASAAGGGPGRRRPGRPPACPGSSPAAAAPPPARTRQAATATTGSGAAAPAAPARAMTGPVRAPPFLPGVGGLLEHGPQRILGIRHRGASSMRGSCRWRARVARPRTRWVLTVLGGQTGLRGDLLDRQIAHVVQDHRAALFRPAAGAAPRPVPPAPVRAPRCAAVPRCASRRPHRTAPKTPSAHRRTPGDRTDPRLGPSVTVELPPPAPALDERLLHHVLRLVKVAEHHVHWPVSRAAAGHRTPRTPRRSTASPGSLATPAIRSAGGIRSTRKAKRLRERCHGTKPSRRA